MANDRIFEWDEVKRRTNLLKHGVDFADAPMFVWETAQVNYDSRFTEARYTALGFLDDRLHAIAFTLRNERVRLISFRKANQREMRSYKNVRSSGGH
jgi:uncharacterized DUF497 family protein